MGTLLVNSAPASVLFDSGASISFMSEAFAYAHDIKCEAMDVTLMIKTPAGQCRTSMIAHNVPVEIEGMEFYVSPVVLSSCDIDLILGMDWLKAHTASIVCATKTVHLLHPSDEIVSYHAHLIRNAEARIYALNALNASPLDGIENIPVVRDFQDFFPEELPGIPPARAVEFVIDLKPGTTPIAKRPYKMPPHELLELKEKSALHFDKASSIQVPLLGEHLLSLSRRKMGRIDWFKIIALSIKPPFKTNILFLGSMICMINWLDHQSSPNST
jgi:hypothetical protein